jgi:hypothetical protein
VEWTGAWSGLRGDPCVESIKEPALHPCADFLAIDPERSRLHTQQPTWPKRLSQYVDAAEPGSNPSAHGARQFLVVADLVINLGGEPQIEPAFE